jgi:N-acetyltransferase
MISVNPVLLRGNGIVLEPLSMEHADGLSRAVEDGELWNLFYTYAPEPKNIAEYIEAALNKQSLGQMLPWAVRDEASCQVIGSTRYHDIVAGADRVEIGYTWYSERFHRTHVNTACKLLLLEHAFDVVGCGVVGFRTDCMNFTSQKAIEALGAKKDGTLRHHSQRKDGSIRDDVFYSILRTEWTGVRHHLQTRLWRHNKAGPKTTASIL